MRLVKSQKAVLIRREEFKSFLDFATLLRMLLGQLFEFGLELDDVFVLSCGDFVDREDPALCSGLVLVLVASVLVAAFVCGCHTS